MQRGNLLFNRVFGNTLAHESIQMFTVQNFYLDIVHIMQNIWKFH